MTYTRRVRRSLPGSVAAVPFVLLLPSPLLADELPAVSALHEAAAEHADQDELVALVAAGRSREAFTESFETGDELFETVFNALDGVGAQVGQGHRFTRVPRADMTGPGEWATHVPSRATGPNASSCSSCHNLPFDDGAGPPSANVHRDPQHTGELARMIQRNTPHLFGGGAVQRLAEEMTQRLQATRDAAAAQACSSGQRVVRELSAKGVDFGEIAASPTGADPCASIDTAGVVGVAPDLVVRPFQWKGSIAFLRDFNRDASHQEIGMQAVELVGEGVDGDWDGVVDEMTIGDQTTLAVYLAAQPRPTTKVELAKLRLIPALARAERDAIGRGAQAFQTAGCADCHTPRLTLDGPTFQEPSRSAAYRDAAFPSGEDPVAAGVRPDRAVRFDLTRDQPDNRILDSRGRLLFHLGAFERDRRGRAGVDLYGDLRRHDMGAALAEPIDEIGTGAATFLTENLWGVGSTAPYLHDGRATTLAEAILLHGGEAQAARDGFAALPVAAQRDVVAFLDNLVLFKLPAEEEAP
jgi:mono/diheme cytochrome c family protein